MNRRAMVDTFRSHGMLIVAAAVLATPLASQAPAQLGWSDDDAARIAFVTAHGHPRVRAAAIVWAPDDSLDALWLDALVDTLASSMERINGLIGGPYTWQRIHGQPVTFYFSPGRFVSHASGRAAVFISLTRVRQGNAPMLHEAVHELVAPPFPWAPFEYPDSAEGERVAAGFPLWLNEGLADYIAQATADATGFHEGDVFEIGGLAKVDSVCAARLAASPRRVEILAKVGGLGWLAPLFTTERAEVAPIYYACSQSFTKFLVGRIGIRATVALLPRIPSGAWLGDVARAAGKPLDGVRRDWMAALRIPGN